MFEQKLELGCEEKLSPELEEFMNELHGIDFGHYDVKDLIHTGDNHYIIPPHLK